MAQTVKVFKWDDPSAPQIVNGLNRDILSVLDACLVNGYGDKTPLGWTKEFTGDSSNPRAIYRNSVANGSGQYLILNSVSGQNDDSGLQIRSAQSVDSIDSYFREGHIQSTRVFENNKYWMVIGTDRAFYFFSAFAGDYNEGRIYTSSFFAGDLANAQPNDQGRFVSFASPIDIVEPTPTQAISSRYGENLEYINYTNNQRLRTDFAIKIWDADGADHSHNYAIYRPFDVLADNHVGSEPIANILYPLHVEVPIDEVDRDDAETDRNGTLTSQSALQPRIRGTLPGFFSASVSYSKNLAYPAFINMPDQQYYLLRNSRGYSPSRLLLAMEVWDD
jgi:hypothetical protein